MEIFQYSNSHDILTMINSEAVFGSRKPTTTSLVVHACGTSKPGVMKNPEAHYPCTFSKPHQALSHCWSMVRLSLRDFTDISNATATLSAQSPHPWIRPSPGGWLQLTCKPLPSLFKSLRQSIFKNTSRLRLISTLVLQPTVLECKVISTNVLHALCSLPIPPWYRWHQES